MSPLSIESATRALRSGGTGLAVMVGRRTSIFCLRTPESQRTEVQAVSWPSSQKVPSIGEALRPWVGSAWERLGWFHVVLPDHLFTGGFEMLEPENLGRLADSAGLVWPGLESCFRCQLDGPVGDGRIRIRADEDGCTLALGEDGRLALLRHRPWPGPSRPTKMQVERQLDGLYRDLDLWLNAHPAWSCAGLELKGWDILGDFAAGTAERLGLPSADGTGLRAGRTLAKVETAIALDLA